METPLLPTVADLFRLDDLPERQCPTDPPACYRFPLPGCLPEEHVLLIEMNRSDVHLLHVPTGEAPRRIITTHLELPELRALTALALSFPYLVSDDQLLMLSQLHNLAVIQAERQGACAAQRAEERRQSVTDLVSTCNGKLQALGLMILRGNRQEQEGYELESLQAPERLPVG